MIFQINPGGNESAQVDVEATFTAPLHVPLHPVSGEQCVSRGTEEARLLRVIAQRASEEHTISAKATPVPFRARDTVR